MCGLAGFTGPGDLDHLRAMTDAIRHRGPDDEGLWSDSAPPVFLGFRRLSIIDLAGGHQPMWTADGRLGVVFNGEIYNHAELRAELERKGHLFSTAHSDTEVLLHGYREWGEALVDRLNGMWAFVIYDRQLGRLFGSRDRFGKKPFYYYHDEHSFVFASELGALIRHPRVPSNLSLPALRKYFAYGYIPAPGTIYERLCKLPAGHRFVHEISSSRLTISRYWDFVIEPEIPAGNPEEIWCERLRELLDKAVRRRLMSDVPLGVFLSGGIDSSAIAALASRHLPAGALNTFSIGFNEPSFDESAYSTLMAEELGTKHRLEILDLEKSCALLPGIVTRLDEPIGDGSLLPAWLLSRFTRQHVTVALGGDGGDELFAGYDPFQALKKARLYASLVPRPVHEAIRLVAARLPVSHRNISLDFKLKRTLSGLSYPPEIWNAVWMGPLEPGDLRDLFREPFSIEEVYSEAIETWDACRQPNLIDRTLQFFTKLYLQDNILAKVDRASMMNSLEARSPFLDIDFVNLARTIPHEYKLRNGETKYILKKALAPILPRRIIARPKKGFGMPIGRWIQSGRFHFDPGDFDASLDPAFIAKQLEEHQLNRADHRLFLWSCWLLATWRRSGGGRS